jgi:RNA polymerase sigma factor (sigma-70 family)
VAVISHAGRAAVVELSSGELASVDFTAFYRRTRDEVARALALTLRDNTLAADAADEAMARAYQRWATVSQLDNPAGWTYRTGLNWSRSFLRRQARRPRPSPSASTGAEPAMVEPAIAAAIARLSVDQRAVIVCRFYLDWSEAQTAEALAIRPGTVKSRLARALARLAPELAHLDPKEQS